MPYFTFILSLLQPVLALPFAFIEILKKNSRHLPVFCISLFFSFLTFTLKPVEALDLSRHYQRIVGLRGLSLENVIQNSNIGYFAFDIYAWVINSLHLPKEAFASSIVFISYYLILSVFIDVKVRYNKNMSQLLVIIIFLIFWLSIGYFGLSSGLRNPLANIVVFFISYQLFLYKRIGLFFFGSVLAFFIHPFAVVPSIAAYLSYNFSLVSKQAKTLVYLGLICSLSSKLIAFGLDKILVYISYLSFYSPSYFDFDSNVGGAAYQNVSSNEFIALVVLPKVPVYLAYFYLIAIKPKTNNSLYLLLCFLCLYLGFFNSFGTVYNRMAAFFLFVFAIFISQEAIYNNSKNIQRFILLYILSLIAYSLMSIYTFRLYLITGLPDLLKPFLFVLFQI